MIGSVAVKLEGSPLGESLGAYGGAELGSSDVRLDWNGGGKLGGSPLGESLGADGWAEIGSSNRISGGKVSGKLEGSPLGESLGADGVVCRLPLGEWY